MSFHVICSTADGNQTKEFQSWEDAHLYANEWMNGFTHWNHRHFNNVESSEYVNLWKTRNGEVVKIQEMKSVDDSEKVWWDDEKAEYNTIDYAIQKQWQQRLQTLREKSVAGINFSDALDTVITRGEYRTLSDEKQREMIQVWLYPTNDNGIIDCPNCADQASIAASGETVLCKTHSDEKHYAEMKEFFIEQSEHLIFKPHLPFCSACGTEKYVVYIGIIITNSGQPLNFAFCVDCRDELTLKQNAARAAQERIGA